MNLFIITWWLCLLISGCGSQPMKQQSDIAKSNTINSTEKLSLYVCSGSEQSMILDTAKVSSMCGLSACRHLYEGLFKLGQDGEITNGQVKEYSVSEDKMTYFFYLRNDIFWSDGKPVTADDFVYAWRRLICEGESYASLLDMVVGAKEIRQGQQKIETLGVKALDDKTLLVELEYPCSYFLEILAFPPTYPVREDIVKAQGDLYATDPERTVYNGAFSLEKWQHQDDLVMRARKNYYAYEEIQVEELTWKLFSNESTMLASFESGDIVYSDTYPSEEAERMKGNGLQIVPGLQTYGVLVNLGNNGAEVLRDVRVRKALCLAIDRERIVQLEKTESTVADAYMPRGIVDENGEDFHEKLDVWYDTNDFESNCKEAKALLAQAGYPNGENFPILKYLVNNAKNQSIAEMILHDWKTYLGIDSVTIVTNTDSFWADRATGNYDLAYFSWNMDIAEGSNMLNTMLSGANDAFFSNELYDLTLQTAQKKTNIQDIWKNYRLCENILSEELPVFPIYYGSNTYLFNDENYENLVYHCGNFYFGYVNKKGEE